MQSLDVNQSVVMSSEGNGYMIHVYWGGGHFSNKIFINNYVIERD